MPRDLTRITPAERRILDLFSDGEAHTSAEIKAAVGEDYEIEQGTVNVYMTNIRKKLPAGQTILCVWVRGKPQYRHVRLLVPDHVA